MKISKGQSKTVNGTGTDNTMDKRTNNDLQSITHKPKDRVTRSPLKIRGTQVFRKGKQFLLH